MLMSTVELLVPLTWPFEISKDKEEVTENHYRHGPYIQLAQVGYKRAVLHFDRDRILQTAVKVALPSMAVALRERTPRDEGIIRIALYFIRNIAMIAPPSSVPMDIDEAEVSRSTTIDTFHEQDIFQVILSIASSIGEDFVTQDIIILEILFFLLKGIDAEKLFMEDKKLSSTNAEELKALIQKEKSMLAGYARHAPTRHNRFGTMIWVKRDNEKVTTISGQDVLGKAQASMQKMDQTKRWNKPKFRGRKNETEQELEEFDLPVSLTNSARKHIKAFIEEFLDSSFNPLFSHIRKAIERETERVQPRHARQFFYLVSWFLRAECARRRTMKERAADPKSLEVLTAEDESYSLVAEVMNQETFILLNRFMQRSQDEKAWRDLNAGMKCFTQILLTVHEMSESALEDDQEIAENIQNRIFYEESTHDRVVLILRSYKDQGFGYLDAVTELSHVFLRMLERYAKQNVDLQIRSKKRTRKIQRKRAQTTGEGGEDEAHQSETEDLQQAQRTVSERKFDFARFSAKFVNQSSVNTFVAYARYYNDLDAEQLKRAHRFFHRVVFKMELGILLYRVDILVLFNKMIKGPERLDPESPAYKEWDEFVKHFFRQVVKRVHDRPELIVEMLFSKMPATMFFLEHGYDRELTVRPLRAPAELEVKPGMELPEQIGVAVGVLVNQSKSDALRWIRDVLTSAVEERKAWEDADEARKLLAATEIVDGDGMAENPEAEAEALQPPSIREYRQFYRAHPLLIVSVIKHDTEERRVAMFKDNKLRLLMNLVGLMRLGDQHDQEATWVIPSSLTSAQLQEAIDLIRKFEFDPPVYEDGKAPEQLLRTKASAVRRSTRRAEFDDDSDDIDDQLEEDHGEYAPGGPAVRQADEPKKKLIRRRRARTPVELDEEEMDRRAEARRKKEREKKAKEKSTIFVHDSDDEDWDEEKDAAFFAREERIRRETHEAFKRSLALGSMEPATSKKRKADGPAKQSKRRKSPPKRRAPFDDSDDDGENVTSSRAASEEANSEVNGVPRVRGGEDEASTALLSSQHAAAMVSDEDMPRDASSNTTRNDVAMDDGDEEDEDVVPVVRRPAARNLRAGFVIESDSE